MSAHTRRFLLLRPRVQRVKPIWRHWCFCCRTFEGRHCERQRAAMSERGTAMSDDRSADDEEEAGIDENEAPFVFELEPAFTQGRAQRFRRIITRALPVLLLTGLLLAVAEQPYLTRWLHRPATDAPVPITVVCDVPWAIIQVDGRGAAIHCAPGIAGALPMARLSVADGIHILAATADGFAPYPIYIVAHSGAPGLYLTQFALTSQGAAQTIAAVNDYFASTYTQDMTYPATLWRTLGLRAPPASPSLLVRERFEAVSLDTYEPTYSETTYLRPIAPEPGTVGVAMVVVEHVMIYDGCGITPLLERRVPVLYAARASVTFSVRPGPQHWVASKPYALNPTAEIYTPPDRAASPASPGGLMALAARAALASLLGGPSALPDAVTITPLASASQWAAGVTLTLSNVARQSLHNIGAGSEAVWLYTGGLLTALTAAAHALSPDALFAASAALDELRASLASQPSRRC
jgi:hypothetical protein